MSCVMDYDFAHCLQLGLGLELGLAFFKDICDNNAHHKFAYIIGNMFDGGERNYKTCPLSARYGLRGRPEELVGRLVVHEPTVEVVIHGCRCRCRNSSCHNSSLYSSFIPSVNKLQEEDVNIYFSVVWIAQLYLCSCCITATSHVQLAMVSIFMLLIIVVIVLVICYNMSNHGTLTQPSLTTRSLLNACKCAVVTYCIMLFLLVYMP